MININFELKIRNLKFDFRTSEVAYKDKVLMPTKQSAWFKNRGYDELNKSHDISVHDFDYINCWTDDCPCDNQSFEYSFDIDLEKNANETIRTTPYLLGYEIRRLLSDEEPFTRIPLDQTLLQVRNPIIILSR